MNQMYRYTYEVINESEHKQSLEEIEIGGLPDQDHIQYSEEFNILTISEPIIARRNIEPIRTLSKLCISIRRRNVFNWWLFCYQCKLPSL